MEVTPTLRKGTLGTWWFHCSTGLVGHSADNEPYVGDVGDGTRLWANHGSWGVCESALEPHQTGKAQGRKTKTPNRTLGNPAVRDYRGASGNVVMAEMGTHPATERARLVTLGLQPARPSSIPTDFSPISVVCRAIKPYVRWRKKQLLRTQMMCNTSAPRDERNIGSLPT
jgi:hypothetical protein